MRRALVAGGRLAFFDVLTGERQPLHLPVPWAGDDGQLSLATPEELRAMVAAAGFAIRRWDDVTDAAADYVAAVLRTTSLPSELGPQIVVPDMAERRRTPPKRRRGSPSSNASPARCEVSNLTAATESDQATNAGSPVTSSTVVGRATLRGRPWPRRTLTTSPSTMNSPPHTERFAAAGRGGEAQAADGATGADRLCPSSLRRVLGEEQGCVRGARIGATGRLGDHDIHRTRRPGSADCA